MLARAIGKWADTVVDERWGGVAVGRVGCAYAPAERLQTLQALSMMANQLRYN